MKRNILKQALFIFSAIFLYSCEGPEGPIGPTDWPVPME